MISNASFAAELRAAGWAVTYQTADDFKSPLSSRIKANQLTELRVMALNDRQARDKWALILI